MKQLVVLICLFVVPAVAQPTSVPPDYEKQALGNEFLVCSEKMIDAKAKVLALQAKVAELEKQLAEVRDKGADQKK